MKTKKLRKKPNKKRLDRRPKGIKLGGDASSLSFSRLPTYGDVFRLFYAVSTAASDCLRTVASVIASDLEVIWTILLAGVVLKSRK